MADSDYFFQQTAETIQQRLNQVPVNTAAIENETRERNEAVANLQEQVNTKQNNLTFDEVPTTNSPNPVKSGGIKNAIEEMGATKQDTLNFDSEPRTGSTNPVRSNGIKAAIDEEKDRAMLAENNLNQQKQGKLIFDTLPTPDSENPVTSGGISQAIANFITKTVNDLVNYYTKADTYTKTEVQQLVDGVKQFKYEVVETLPTASSLTMNKIYLVPSPNQQTRNAKDEFITIATEQGGATTYSWEQIGSTTVDLSGYATTSQMTAAINSALIAYSTTEQMNAAIAAALSNYYTKAEITAALGQKQDVLEFDATPTAGSVNPVTSGGVKTAIDAMGNTKQNTLTFDATPTAGSQNPVTSGGVKDAIANFITASVNNLTNYYLKSETYTKAEVQQMIAGMAQFEYKVVQTLPTASADTMRKIYLVPSTNPVSSNVKDEFITIQEQREVEGQTVIVYAWEQIGTTTVDLSGYSTTAQMNAAIQAALADYSTTAQITTAIATALSAYYTKEEVDATIQAINTSITNINNKIPAEASSQNQLADKAFVTSGLSAKQAKITDGAQIGLGMGTCSTAVGTAAKAVSIQNFLLLQNMPVTITFTNAISVDGATLNISSTGAKPIFIQGAALQAGVVKAGDVVTLIYDGTNWNIVEILSVSTSQSDLYVDMGLPSGRLWAIANIDVTTQSGFAEVDGKPSPYKYECTFFSWGNTEGHNPTSTSAFGYDWGSANDGPYASTPGAALTANAGLSFDAARAILGSPWRDPSTEDFAELFANSDYIDANGDVIDAATTNKLVTVNSIVGIRLKSKINGSVIFFPAAGGGYGQSWYNRGSSGYYWSRSLHSQAYGRLLIFYSGGVSPQGTDNRFHGFSRRAVQ